jgi:hypothetical protein
MIDALVNYLHLAYPSALQLCKNFDKAAVSMIKGLSSVDWPESSTLDEIGTYSQVKEREMRPLTSEWPSLRVVDTPIRISIE